jgi:hypothetical protein
VPTKLKINLAFVLLLLGFILELGVLTYLKNPRQYYFLPFVWSLGAVLTAIGLYWQSTKPEQVVAHSIKFYNYSYLVFAIAAIFVSYFIYRLCLYNPPDPLQSDVVPTIEQMAKRVLNNEYPFKYIQFPSWGFEPGYLTMQFLPFVVPEMLGMDYRYWAFILFLISLFFIVKWLHNTNSNLLEIIIKILIPFVAIGLIIYKNPPIFTHSVELLDVAYYLFLAYSLFSKSNFLRGLALSLCLLSRYGLLFWVPVYAIIYFMQYGKVNALKVATYTFVVILVLYVLPFMTKDPFLFFKSISNYGQMAVTQWESNPDWYKHIGKPYTLAQGLGFALYFNDFVSGSTIHKIEMMKNVQLIFCLLVGGLSIFLFHKKRSQLNCDLYLLFTFKLFLFLFYGLLFVPFTYLYIVPLFVSLAAIYKVNFIENVG